MYKHIAANKRNTLIIMLGFILLIAAIAAVFAWWFGDWTIMIWVIVISAGYACLQYFIAGKLATAMTGARKVQKKDSPRLWNAVENLCITTGLPMPQVYVIDDPAPNAFATGRDPQHALVAATTGLLDIMDDKELTAVMAHELSHVKNYDIRVSTIVFGLVCVVGLLSDIGVRMMYYGGGNDNERNNSPVGLIIMLVTAIVAPLAASLAQLAVSRQREYLADSSAAMITRYPEGMISALKKLEAHARPMRQQNPAAEALFIANPMRKGTLSLSSLFSTHPPIEKRIARLEHGEKSF
jgi:heat shock protein HtpX